MLRRVVELTILRHKENCHGQIGPFSGSWTMCLLNLLTMTPRLQFISGQMIIMVVVDESSDTIFHFGRCSLS